MLVPIPMKNGAVISPLLTVLFVFLPCSVFAQAWLPDKGEGTVELQYINFQGGDHLFSTDALDGQTSRGYTAEGSHWYLGDTVGHTALLLVDYSLHARFAFSANIAWVTSKYEGHSPVNLDVDDGNYHSTWQDFGFNFRGVALDREVVITPFVGLGTPVQKYPISGHTVAGRGLREFRFGTNIGWIMDSVLPAAYLHGSFTYGLAEKVDDVRLSRVNIDLEAGYLVRSFAFRAMGGWQNTLWGIDWVSGDPNDPQVHGEGATSFTNQLSASRFARLGLGLSYSFLDAFALSTSLFYTVWGENIEQGTFLVAGLNWNFQTKWAPVVEDWGEDW